MSAQKKPKPWTSKDEEYAYYRRRDHAHIEAMQNYVIAELTRRAALLHQDEEKPPNMEMPTNARHLLSAIQGAHGGGVTPYEEFERDYLSIGRQLQFTGTDDAIRSRVRRWIGDLVDWQYAVGYELMHIVPGGKVIGYRDDGTPIRTKTVFIDHLKPPADEGVQRARFSPEWKAHPGHAMEAQTDSVIKKLPELGTRAESGAEKTPPDPQSVAIYEKLQEDRICEAAEKVADQIEMRGGDSALFLEKLELRLKRIRDSRQKTAPARRDYASLSIFDEDPQEAEASATANTCNTEEGFPQAQAPASESPRNIHNARSSAENAENPNKPPRNMNDTQSKKEPNMLEWALFWAGQGIPVFPVHSVNDGVCTCPCNKECRGDTHKCGSGCESKGKHPISRLARNGSKSGTTDPEIIRRWWTEEPNANVGGRMGGDVRLLALDVDPRAGGDASFYDLVETFGEKWAKTLRHITGALGFHLFFTIPEGVEFQRAKLAPGIDLKWHNGYVVLPPSIHLTGRSYEIAAAVPVIPAPEWLIEELTRERDEIPTKVVDFQERKARLSGDLQEKFYEPGRNIGLFGVGMGRWRHGWAADVTKLHAQLLEVNAARCVPPLSDAEVAKMAAHIAADYARLRGIDAAEGGRA